MMLEPALSGRQVDFRPGRARGPDDNRAQVVAGFGQFHRHPLEHAGELHKAAAILREASTRLSAVDTGTPLMRARWRQATWA